MDKNEEQQRSESSNPEMGVELPSLTGTRLAELALIVDALVQAFQPDRVYVFGSHARGTGTENSDLDLFVVVPDAGAYPHHLAQEAFRVIGHHTLPLDLIFMGREEFDRRADSVTSLPATVLREGELIYAGTA